MMLRQKLNPVPAISAPIHQVHLGKHSPAAHQCIDLRNSKLDLLCATPTYKDCHSINLTIATGNFREQLSIPMQKDWVVNGK